MSWITATTVDELRTRPVVVRHPPFQVLVLRSQGQVYAVDNRCPHEGYPLAEGTLTADEPVVTCNWHNWKFRLTDGRCLVGGDNVRTYPVRVEDGTVFIDLARPGRAESEQRILGGLRIAFDDRDFGRICREITRLDFEGIDPGVAVRSALRWWHDRVEYGTTHAMAAMVDWLNLASAWSNEREKKLICLSEAVDHLSFDALRRPSYPFPAAGESFDAASFCALVEAERANDAEAMVRRGIEDGIGWDDMEGAFVEASLAHYNSFGHCLIYTSKVRGALELLGTEQIEFLALPLARKIAFATREDLIPEFRAYRSVARRLSAGVGATGGRRTPDLETPFPATLPHAFEWLESATAGFGVEAVYDALLEALALSMLHCDLSYDSATDRPVGQNVGWLDFTHGITFANAVRVTCRRHPRHWPQGLAQMACFLGRNSSFLDETVDPDAWAVGDAAEFLGDTFENLLDHGMRDPIFSAHLVKTSVAVRDELEFASPTCRKALLASLNRFLHSPIKMKHVRRNVRQAMALVSRDYA